MAKTALIFESHSDDLAVGIGGTIIKLIKEGYVLIDVIFSAGQKSHPHYKEEVIIKKRIKETEGVARRFGIKQTILFGLEDNNLKEEIKNKNINERIRRIIKKFKPVKIFITSETDPHPDHRAVYHAVLKVVGKLNYNCEIYSYEVWNIINENKPVIYNDITPYFKAKVAMMKSFRSQSHFMYLLLIPIYLRSKFYGIMNNCKYAEKLYRIR